MACDLKKIADLPIREDFKIAIIEFLQQPQNAAACEKVTSAPPEQIMALLDQMEQGMAQQAEGGNNQPQAGPGTAPAGPPASGGGIASIPQAASGSQIPPGIPPGQLADVPRPMDMPSDNAGIMQVPPPNQRRY